MNSILHGFYHTVLTGVAVSIPVVLMGGYTWETLTIGGILAWIANWAKIVLTTPAVS